MSNAPDIGLAGISSPDGSVQVSERIPPPSVSALHGVPLLRTHMLLSLLDVWERTALTPPYASLLAGWREVVTHANMDERDRETVTRARVVLATGNQHKLTEHRIVLSDSTVGPVPQLIDQSELGVPNAEETCDTLVGNAALKAFAAAYETGLPAVSDDTGLFINALQGHPGVYTARYAGHGRGTAEVKAKILQQMTGVTNRGATFRTVAALADPAGPLERRILWVQAESHGVITETEHAADPQLGGWGLDPIFAPDDLERDRDHGLRTFAEVSTENKLRISHRGRAFTVMRYCLSTYLASKARL